MNLMKVAILIVLLLCFAVVTGCSSNGGHARRSSPKGKQVALEPSMTGFWQTRVVYADAY